ncbi:MAG: hypothetical protein JWP10_708 [Nocardioidaceae bacterium]|nr:hypothetical protein [Nocardioidaceae bacterium]
MPILSKLRRPTTVVLAVVGCLLAVVSLVSVWGRNQILDTDRYIANVKPLANDPIIQDEVARHVSKAITDQFDAEARAKSALPERAQFLAPALGEEFDRFIRRKSLQFTRSDAFPKLWVSVNSVGHRELVDLLTVDGATDTVAITNGRLRLDLTSMVTAVRDQLARAGLQVVAALPPITLVIDIADAEEVENARMAVTWLDRAANWLPFVTLGILIGAIALSRRRLRAGVLIAISLMVTMILTRGAISMGASIAANHIPRSIASTDAVHAYYKHLTALLRRGALLVGLAATVAGLIAVAFGPARSAIERRGFSKDDLPSVRQPLRLAIVLVAGGILLVWYSPGVAGAFAVILLAAAAIVVVSRVGASK